jgi:flagellar FliL protein
VAAKPAKPAPAADAATPPASSKKLILIIALVAILAGAGVGAAFVLMKPSKHAADEEAETQHQAPPQYIAMDPAFVVNLADPGTVKYLQADVQLQTHDPKTAEAITLHMPLIRNRLLLLLGQQTSQQLTGRDGKEHLQTQALNEVRAVLKAQHAPDKVDALLFTSLVIQ